MAEWSKIVSLVETLCRSEDVLVRTTSHHEITSYAVLLNTWSIAEGVPKESVTPGEKFRQCLPISPMLILNTVQLLAARGILMKES
jgi:hypothetical protein